MEVLEGTDRYKIDYIRVAGKKQMRGHNRPYRSKYLMFRLVGAEGFEPPTLCSQSRCATRLRYAPTDGLQLRRTLHRLHLIVS